MPLGVFGALTLGCDNGHRFDANRRGYLSTIEKSRGIHGDSKEILRARAEFLGLGLYEPIADLVDDCLPHSPDRDSLNDAEDDLQPRGLRILDSGCGTGYYLAHLLESRPDASALALDASADAVAMTVAATGASGLVADVWQPSAVRDDTADVVLCVFAPRNAAEFARVLTPTGRLIVVTPRENHLAELRETGEMIGIHPDKLAALDAGLVSEFNLVDRQSIVYERALDIAARSLVAAMGPSGHHDRAEPTSGATITIAVDVSVYAPRT